MYTAKGREEQQQLLLKCNSCTLQYMGSAIKSQQ